MAVRGRQCHEGSQAWTACGVSGAHLLGWEGGCGSTLRGLPGVTAPGAVSQDQVTMEALTPKAREWGEEGSRPSGLQSREKRRLGPGRTRELAEIGGRGRAPVRKAPGSRVDMDPKGTLWKGPKLLVISVSVWVPGGCGADGLGRGGGAALPESWLGEGRWGQQREEGVWVVAGKRCLFRKRETGSRARAGTPEGTGTQQLCPGSRVSKGALHPPPTPFSLNTRGGLAQRKRGSHRAPPSQAG